MEHKCSLMFSNIGSFYMRYCHLVLKPRNSKHLFCYMIKWEYRKINEMLFLIHGYRSLSI